LEWSYKRVDSPEGGILVVFYYPSAAETFGWSGLIRGVASPEGGILLVFYYPSAAETFGWRVHPSYKTTPTKDFRFTGIVKYY
jgi:hypothetical protein